MLRPSHWWFVLLRCRVEAHPGCPAIGESSCSCVNLGLSESSLMMRSVAFMHNCSLLRSWQSVHMFWIKFHSSLGSMSSSSHFTTPVNSTNSPCCIHLLRFPLLSTICWVFSSPPWREISPGILVSISGFCHCIPVREITLNLNLDRKSDRLICCLWCTFDLMKYSRILWTFHIVIGCAGPSDCGLYCSSDITMASNSWW